MLENTVKSKEREERLAAARRPVSSSSDSPRPRGVGQTNNNGQYGSVFPNQLPRREVQPVDNGNEFKNKGSSKLKPHIPTPILLLIASRYRKNKQRNKKRWTKKSLMILPGGMGALHLVLKGSIN
ncbi:MAG: hypothetical protein WCJ51_03360, partial [Candidatus Moraniibacteriota bacterium]